MKNRPVFVISFFVLLILGSTFTSCELINPEEQIPSFLRIDSISLNVLNNEGTSDQNIVDAWVFEDEKLIGIYELPATVAILKNGESSIRIRGGIKLNGQVGTRIPYLFTEDYQAALELFPDSQLHVNPTLSFGGGVTFAWLEDFENSGVSLISTALSEADPVRVDGAEAFDGRSLKLALDASQNIFECKTGSAFELPSGGTPVIMEFRYKSNHSLVVGIFSRDQNGSFQVPILILNPSEDWNFVYVNLTDVISTNVGFIDHRPFFGFVRNEGFEGEINVYLDNIRMLH